MRVLVAGSRDMTDLSVMLRALSGLSVPAGERLTIIHGGARGADELASEVAAMLGANEYRFPATWTNGKSAGPVRNQEMLDILPPDLVMAFPSPDSRGTRDMIRRAEKAGIPVVVTDVPAPGL